MRHSTDLTSDPLVSRKHYGSCWKEMNFWPNPQGVTHFHTLIEMEQTSPSQTLLPNPEWGISHPHSVEIAYYLVFSISRFTPFCLGKIPFGVYLIKVKEFHLTYKKGNDRF